jgi:hypothetical protein
LCLMPSGFCFKLWVADLLGLSPERARWRIMRKLIRRLKRLKIT